MKVLRSLFRSRPDPRQAMRPLWHRVVEESRTPALYAEDGVADTIAGRFDMITAILALVLLRMERDRLLAQESVWLTELFVDDMDAQLRETGVGDVMVGKHLGKLMSVLGGRLGAFREALEQGAEAPLSEALARNVTMAQPGRSADDLARRLRAFYDRLCGLDSKRLLAGSIDL